LVGTTSIDAAACARRVILKLRLFGDANAIVADSLLVCALPGSSWQVDTLHR
jgi:hypothetical protein